MRIKNPLYGLLPLTLCIILYVSCKKDETNSDEPQEGLEFFESIEVINGIDTLMCDEEKINNFSGTACCITGFIEALPKDTIQFKYVSNLINSQVTWTVESGELAIISNEDQTIIMIEVLENFDGGSIIGYGTGEDTRKCSERLKITLK